MSGQRSSIAVWHDVECGSYSADLALWEELSSQAGGAVLDLGCGTGRVAIHLARRGFKVVGLDVDPDLLVALSERAEGLSLQPVLADARRFELDTEIALALAPMQLIQLLPSSADRLECLSCIAAHLSPGGRIALAIVERLPEPDGDVPPLPDVREVEGWVYSSLPVDSAESDGEIAIRRLRQTVSPAGALSEEGNEIRIRTFSAVQLEREGEEAGLVAIGRHAIPPTDLHVGSTVVVLGRAE
jgi:SAM-dependent methyltransferase